MVPSTSSTGNSIFFPGRCLGGITALHTRWQRYCSIEKLPMTLAASMSGEEIFWRRVQKSAGCWLRGGAKTKFGYSKMTYDGGRYEDAHRFSYRLHFGDIPVGMCVLHRCDVPSCVNPEHLFLGTKRDNALDCQAKDRSAAFRKKTHCKRGHEFTEDNVIWIGKGKTGRNCRKCAYESHRKWNRRKYKEGKEAKYVG